MSSITTSISEAFGRALSELDPRPLRRAADAIELVRPSLTGLSGDLARAASMGAVLHAMMVASTPSTPPPPAPAAALAPAPPPPRRRGGRQRRPQAELFNDDGTIRSEWDDEHGNAHISQATTTRILGLSRHYLRRLEADDRLLRCLRPEHEQKVYFLVEQVQDIREKLAALPPVA